MTAAEVGTLISEWTPILLSVAALAGTLWVAFKRAVDKAEASAAAAKQQSTIDAVSERQDRQGKVQTTLLMNAQPSSGAAVTIEAPAPTPSGNQTTFVPPVAPLANP